MRPLIVSLLVICTAVVAFPGCDDDCDDGTCVCAEGASCEFECDEPPCHVDCKGNNDSCTGACGNGECTCGSGSNCDFRCATGPCHVDCAGENDECSGTCQNGTCTCGRGSHCDFVCADNNCHTHCEAGATCTLSCPDNSPGSQGCIIDTCAAGATTICADDTIVCGVACPS